MGSYGQTEADEKDPALRDQRLEQRYDFDKGSDGDLSTVAWVSSNQSELVREFWEWRRGFAHIPEWRDALRTWEAGRFGSQLEPAAHGILAFACRQSLSKSPQEERPEPKRPSLSPQERTRRFDEAVGRMAREKLMESDRPGKAEASA